MKLVSVRISFGEGLVVTIDVNNMKAYGDEKSLIAAWDAKVVDTGVYELYIDNKLEITFKDCYVPKFIPNEWQDYLDLNIDDDNRLLNWHTTPEQVINDFKSYWV